MFILGNQVLRIDQAFTGLDGTQYPMNWLRLTTLEEKEAIGIKEITDPVRPDDRFYYVDGNNIGTPRDLASLKADWKVQINETAYAMLAPTDWYVVRKAEGGADIPANVSAFRAAVRAAADSNQAALNNAADFDTFVQATAALVWPVFEGGN